MTILVVQQLVLQLLIPLGLLSWLILGIAPSRVGWAVRAVLVGAYLVAVAFAGVWLLLPWYVVGIYFALFLIALLLARRSPRPSAVWPSSARGGIALGFQLVFALLSVGVALQAFAGRRPPDRPLFDLSFPLEGGTYLVVNGGSNDLVNAHVRTLSGERFRPYRGQSHGVDLVKLNRWGFRARQPAPSDPAAYVIFGDPVRAPCSGRVVQAVDGLADLSPPRTDRDHMAGNHVLLACGEVWVLLAHLQQGTVRVHQGDRVETGQALGQVGNTGNTSEPHLHIHAQTPGTDGAPLGGEPLPILLNGRYFVRNMRIATDG